MILTIIAIIAVVIGLVMMFSNREMIMELGALLFGVGGIAAVIMLGIIIITHVGVDVYIERNRIEYEALCERLEIANSDYEDVSKSDVVKDVADWNKNVYSYKHWAYNPWTNWFYSRRVADELKIIERGQDEITR